jgi:hypothetical protein
VGCRVEKLSAFLEPDLTALERFGQDLAVPLLDGAGKAMLLGRAFNPAQHPCARGQPRAANRPGLNLGVAIIRHGVGPSYALISHHAIQQCAHPRDIRGVIDVDRSCQGINDPVERLTRQARAAHTAPPGAILPGHFPLLR